MKKFTKVSLFVALMASQCIAHAAATFGTYETPFSATSPWNMKPVNPTLDPSFVIPKDVYYPSINQGAFSASIYRASESDPATKIYGHIKNGVAQKITTPDFGYSSMEVTIPHMPVNVVPASGGDGHADIIDEKAGVIHSFWQLRYDAENRVWRTTLYAVSPLKGSGWPDGGRWYQGARAVGTSVTGGMIRKHEARDGKPIFEHALAMSLSQNGLAYAGTGYVFPAGSADSSFRTNKGKIPEGSLMMLPADYDTSKIVNKDLKKVADTLKVYGAYVADGNYGTPFFIYVENGSTFNVHEKPDGTTGWNNATANELQRMREALRPVKSAQAWVDGTGVKRQKREDNLNLVSMRGPYYNASKSPIGVYNTLNGYLEFNTPANAQTYQWNWSISMYGASFINWLKPKVGETFIIRATAINGATAALDCTLKNPEGKWQQMNNKQLKDGESFILKWTDQINYCGVVAKSGTTGGYSAVKLDMKRYSADPNVAAAIK